MSVVFVKFIDAFAEDTLCKRNSAEEVEDIWSGFNGEVIPIPILPPLNQLSPDVFKLLFKLNPILH